MKIIKPISPQFKTTQKPIVFENSYINEKTNKRYFDYTKKYGRIPTQGCQIIQKNFPEAKIHQQQNKLKKQLSVGNFFILNPNQTKKHYLQREVTNQQNLHHTMTQPKSLLQGGVYYHKKEVQQRNTHKFVHNRVSFKYSGQNGNNKSHLQKKSIANLKGGNTFGLNRNTEVDYKKNNEIQRKVQFRHTYLEPDSDLQDRQWPKGTKKRTSNKQNASIGPKHPQKISIKRQKSKKYVNNFNFTTTENDQVDKKTRVHTETIQNNQDLRITKQSVFKAKDISQEILNTNTNTNANTNNQSQEKYFKRKKQIQTNWLKKKYSQNQIKTEPCQQIIRQTSNKIIDWRNQLILNQKIGQGTFGKVYIAKKRDTCQIFAVKKVLVDKKYKSRELEVVTSLNSKFVMKVYGVFTTIQKKQEYLNIVMQYYSQNLYQRINSQNKPKLALLQQKILIYQMLKGLSYIHSRHICHRDIKPHNMLVQNCRLVLCDFGSAKILVKNEPNLSYICSRCYRAPQLIFGSTKYTTQIDMWALGCVILQMINKIPLFIGQNSLDHLLEVIKVLGTPTRQQVLEMNPSYDISDYQMPFIKRKSLSKLFPQVDINLIDLLNKLLIYSPMQRLTAIDALGHKYFDEIRQRQSFQKIRKYLSDSSGYSGTQNEFFSFDQKQMKQKRNSKVQLVPNWYKK